MKKLTPMQIFALEEAQTEYDAAIREYNAACKSDIQANISTAHDRAAAAQSELATVKAEISKA